jgi:hypothetical protein
LPAAGRSAVNLFAPLKFACVGGLIGVQVQSLGVCHYGLGW